MEPYRNLSGNSGVLSFEVRETAIDVTFADGVYRYTFESAGRENVEEMVRLARSGTGLATFISRTVKDRYASRRRR
jgi:hypothetical protein